LTLLLIGFSTVQPTSQLAEPLRRARSTGVDPVKNFTAPLLSPEILEYSNAPVSPKRKNASFPALDRA
jgi:hypothetical protein